MSPLHLRFLSLAVLSAADKMALPLHSLQLVEATQPEPGSAGGFCSQGGFLLSVVKYYYTILVAMQKNLRYNLWLLSLRKTGSIINNHIAKKVLATGLALVLCPHFTMNA